MKKKKREKKKDSLKRTESCHPRNIKNYDGQKVASRRRKTQVYKLIKSNDRRIYKFHEVQVRMQNVFTEGMPPRPRHPVADFSS